MAAKKATTEYAPKIDNPATEDFAALNETARLCRTISLTYLFAVIVIIALGFSADDETLLRERPLILPPFNVEISVVGFFFTAPWVIVVLHAHLLFKMSVMQDTAARIDEEVLVRNRHLLFAYEGLLWAASPSGMQKAFIRAWLFVIHVVLPIGALLFLLIEFLDYQSEMITWFQRAAIFVEAIMIWFMAKPGRWVGRARLPRDWRGFAAKVFGAPILACACLSFFLICVRGGTIDRWVEGRHIPNVIEFDIVVEDTSHPWRQWRTLSLSGRTLVPETTNPAILSKLIENRHGFAETWSREGLGLDLRGRSLRGADFSETVLIAARMSGSGDKQSDYSAANFRSAKLRYVDLTHALLAKADFQEAEMEGATLSYANLHQADLRKAQLGNATAIEAWFGRAAMREVHLEQADLKGARFDFAGLAHANLAGARLEKMWREPDGTSNIAQRFRRAHFHGADLFRANLIGSNLEEATFVGADLRYANFMGVEAVGTVFKGANLRGALMVAANLRTAELQGTHLTSGNLTGTDLRGVDLSAALIPRIKFKMNEIVKSRVLGDIAGIEDDELRAEALANIDKAMGITVPDPELLGIATSRNVVGVTSAARQAFGERLGASSVPFGEAFAARLAPYICYSDAIAIGVRRRFQREKGDTLGRLPYDEKRDIRPALMKVMRGIDNCSELALTLFRP